MSNTFKKKKLGEMFQYIRPSAAPYENEDGDMVLSPRNRLRYEYLRGKFQGIKFGAGDSMNIPLIYNTAWTGEAVGTFFVLGRAPIGETWFTCGGTSIDGVGCQKLHILNLTAPEVAALDPVISVFASKPDDNEYRHLMLAKFYGETVDLTGDEDYTAMIELNEFMHQSWGGTS